jgi:hypothetical protein
MISYFRIPPDTEMYRTMADFMKEANACDRKAIEWAKTYNEHGTIKTYGSGWGKIACIGFKKDQEVPKGWIKKGTDSEFTFYRPNGRTIKGKVLHDEMNKLPQKSIFILNNIFMFHEDAHVFYPGFFYSKSSEVLILQVYTKNVQYWLNRPDSAIELTSSQYLELTKTEE